LKNFFRPTCIVKDSSVPFSTAEKSSICLGTNAGKNLLLDDSVVQTTTLSLLVEAPQIVVGRPGVPVILEVNDLFDQIVVFDFVQFSVLLHNSLL